MELIKNNPFRIAGVLSNASARELERQKAKMTAFAKVGKEAKSEYDFESLGEISRTDIAIVEKAFSDIEQNQDRVKHALFWFLNINAFDNTAIEYLKNGKSDKAIEIWGKVTDNRDVNQSNFSAFNNLGSLKLLSSYEEEIKEGIKAKIELIESDYFEDFVHTVADETYTIDNDKQIEKFIDELLIHLNSQYPREKTIELFDNCNGSAQSYLLRKFTEDPIYKIESQIESSKYKRKESQSDLYRTGLNLYLHCKDDLIFLRSILGVNDLRYKMIADNLAKEIMQCGIDYFNERKENNSTDNYLENAEKLTKIADGVAVGKLTKDRAQDNLATLADMKHFEINQAIALLKSVKEAYETNERNIREQVRELEKTDIGIILGQESINYQSVEENIKNSIDWDKVVSMILEIIPQSNIDKINNTVNDSKLVEFKSLVNFLFSKLQFSQINKVKYLTYKRKNDILSNLQVTIKLLPTWSKWVAGIAIFILLVVLASAPNRTSVNRSTTTTNRSSTSSRRETNRNTRKRTTTLENRRNSRTANRRSTRTTANRINDSRRQSTSTNNRGNRNTNRDAVKRKSDSSRIWRKNGLGVILTTAGVIVIFLLIRWSQMPR